MLPKKGFLSLDFLVPNLALVVAFISIQTFYTIVVRPRAAELQLERRVKAAQAAAQPGKATDMEQYQRSVFLIIKDEEPKFEVIFCFWGMMVLCYKMVRVTRERRLLKHDFIQVQEGERIIPEDALDRYKELKAVIDRTPQWRDRLLPDCVLASLQRFHASNSIQDAATAVRERADIAADSLDSSLSLIRYIAWAIPAIGFVGTVRGIGHALSFAEEAIKGNLSAVTSNLGLAFNSTFVGLILCIFLMYLLHIVQSSQEELIIDIRHYCRDKLIDVMKVPAREEATHSVI
jgi:biopolymer transport protein ExbB/TolQ